LEKIENFPDYLEDNVLVDTNGLESDFFNMSKVMDCVECDKFKLWGKVQIAGMGTAMKILLTDLRFKSWRPSQFLIHLSRNELVSLFNAFGRISSSIRQLVNFPYILN
jgi:hypothetical protein